MSERIQLGRLNSNAGTYADGELLFLEKHKWDCGWYWGFGYIGNKNCHFHFESLLENTKYASELFKQTNISDSDWWVIRDLFKQAYALKGAAETYRHGGHQTTRPGVTDILKNKEKADELNKDLQAVLDTVWEFTKKAATFHLEMQ